MSGYSLILKIQSLEKQLHDLGMRWGHDKHGQWGGHEEFGDRVAVFPRDEELPIYSRDAMLFCGTIYELQNWINGITWSRGYDMLLKVSDDNKRIRKEQDERNKQLAQRLKNEKIEVIGS